MAIIIKEITVKTTIENHMTSSTFSELEQKRLKAEILNEVKDLFKKKSLRTGRR